MKKNFMRRNYGWFLFLAAILAMNACKKEHPKPPQYDAGVGGDTTSTSVNQHPNEDSLKFYVWWINESDSANIPLYYWYDQVPDLDPFSSQFDKAKDLLNYMRSFAVVNGKKVDHYSFLDRTGQVSGELEGGISGDFGFGIAPVQYRDGAIHLIVTHVYEGSPAGNAGIQRGWDITSINGNSKITWDGGENYQAIIKAVYSNPSTSFTFTKPDGSDKKIDLTRAEYHINPVLFDSIYTVNNEKVGYFVYNAFISVGSDANGVRAKQEIDDAFDKFKVAGIKDLIVDIRDNGGGAVVSTAYLDNLIAPSSTNGQVMFTYEYNDPLTNYFNSNNDLTPTKFNLAPSNLNLNRVFFIVGRGTASASELTINNLKPYMDVKLIGDTTYGKPVGFFPIPISFVTKTDGYKQVATMYAINFRSINKNGKGDYYSGMAPDKVYQLFDGFNWGDTRDTRLSDALNYIKTGSFARNNGLNRKVSPQHEYKRVMRNKTSNPYKFNGMVDYRLPKQINFPLKKK